MPRLPLRRVYAVVSFNGAGIYSRHLSFLEAKKSAPRHLQHASRPLEIQRDDIFDGGGHRYWMRCRNRWELWDPRRDYDLRKPDFLLIPEAQP
jgi:hypothetical protein